MCDFFERDYNDDEMQSPIIYENAPINKNKINKNNFSSKMLCSIMLLSLSVLGLQNIEKCEKEKDSAKNYKYLKSKLQHDYLVAVILFINSVIYIKNK